MKPYQQYKASGISWIGEIPNHWSKLKLRSILKPVTVRNRTDLPLLSVVREKGVILRNIENKNENHNYIPDDLSNYKLVQKGQLAMNKMKAWQGSYGLSNYEGIVSPAYYVFSISGVFNYFFHLALRSKVYVPFFTSASDGVRVGQWDLNLNRMKEIPFYLPTNEEQQQIVRYIDWKTTKIHKFIKAKKKLIALLKEQKQKIINEVVTKGINPDVHMKDSGVDWLGEIPEHWEFRKIKHITKILRGKFSYRPRNDPSLYDGQYPFIQTGDVARARKYINFYKQTLNEKGYQVSKEFPKGTLTMTIAANIGEVAILDFKACFPDSIVGFVPLKATVDYLYYLFISMKSELLREAPINTQGNLNIERIGNMLGVVPPIKARRYGSCFLGPLCKKY